MSRYCAVDINKIGSDNNNNYRPNNNDNNSNNNNNNNNNNNSIIKMYLFNEEKTGKTHIIIDLWAVK